MRVNGELFFLMNVWMDFLALLLTARWTARRLSRGRALAASALGAAFALLACGVLPAPLRMALLGPAALGMARIAFPRRAAALFPYLMASCLFLTGLSRFLWRQGMPTVGVMALCGGCAWGLMLLRGRRLGAGERLALRITWRGETAEVPALRDSGNLLTDGLTGLPVIVAPARPWTQMIVADALPAGCRLLPVRTAAGKGLLPCVRPDRLELLEGGKKTDIDAVVAFSAADFSRALVPDAFF